MKIIVPISLEGEVPGWLLTELLEGAGGYLFEGELWWFLWFEVCDEDIWLGVFLTGVHQKYIIEQ